MERLRSKLYLAIGLLLAAALVVVLLPVKIHSGIEYMGDGRTKRAYGKENEEADALEGKVIFLDAGHGIGAVGGTVMPDGYTEHEYTLKYTLALKEKLEAEGATVILTRDSATDVENLVRMAKVNLYTLGMIKEMEGFDVKQISRLELLMQGVVDDPKEAERIFNSPYDTSYQRRIHPELRELFELQATPVVSDNVILVSIHTNALPDEPDFHGTETYYLNNEWHCIQKYFKGYTNVSRSKQLAEMFVKSVSVKGGFRNNGAKVNDYFMLRETNVPAVLIEIGYHTNGADKAKIMDSGTQDSIVDGMCDTILEYFALVDGR